MNNPMAHAVVDDHQPGSGAVRDEAHQPARIGLQRLERLVRSVRRVDLNLGIGRLAVRVEAPDGHGSGGRINLDLQAMSLRE